MSKAGPSRVVILGGGFGGVGAAVELARRALDRRMVEVHLVSDENYFVFHPLLVEVVSCRVEPSHVVSPIRHLCRHATVHCAHVQDFDPKRKCVTLVTGDGRSSDTLAYDHLILSLGLRPDPRAIPGMAAFYVHAQLPQCRRCSYQTTGQNVRSFRPLFSLSLLLADLLIEQLQ